MKAGAARARPPCHPCAIGVEYPTRFLADVPRLHRQHLRAAPPGEHEREDDRAVAPTNRRRGQACQQTLELLGTEAARRGLAGMRAFELVAWIGSHHLHLREEAVVAA